MNPGIADRSVGYQALEPNGAESPALETTNDCPKGYKRSEVGVIPEDWEVLDIGSLDPFITSGSRGWAEFYSEFGDSFVRITNMTRESIYLDVSDMRYVKLPTGSSEGKRTSLQDGDVLISITADIGICSYVDASLTKPAYINQHVALVRFDAEAIDSKYISYFLASEQVQQLFRGAADLGAKAGMNLESVRRLQIALPGKVEQTAIANALSDIDALISELDTLIAKKQAIKTATMQQLLTGRTRLPAFAKREDGTDKGYKPSELGEIPEDWNLSNLKSVSFASSQNGLFYEPSRKGTGIPMINVGDLYKSAPINVEDLELFNATGNELNSFRVSSGDLFFTRSSVVPSGIAHCNLFLSGNNNVVFDSHLVRVRPDQKIVNPKYLYLNCISKHSRTALVSAAKTATMTTIDQGAINSCPVFLPPIEEQTAIANILSDMDTEITTLQQRQQKTRQIKQGMMQELLTGRTRLV